MTVINTIRQNAAIYRKRVFARDGSIRINHDQTRNKVFDSRSLPALSCAELQELGYLLMTPLKKGVVSCCWKESVL